MTIKPNFEELEKFSKQQIDTANAFAATLTKGLQEIAAETTEYSKQAFAANSSTVEKLLGARTVQTAVEIQTEYAKSAYDGFVAQATKLNDLYAKLAGEAFKPLGAAFAAFQAK